MLKQLDRTEVLPDFDPDARRIDENGIKYYFCWILQRWLPTIDLEDLEYNTEADEYMARIFGMPVE